MSKKIRAFGTAQGEHDTYQGLSKAEKEQLSEAAIRQHWEKRAQRPTVQSVMSARHTFKENEQATIKLKRDIFRFLVNVLPCKSVFELGFGIGRMTTELAIWANQVVGNELSSKMLARAKDNLANYSNVELRLGRITELGLPAKSFDLVFDSIVLLHILNPEELSATIKEMQRLSNRIFILEHTDEGPDFPISKYSILRKPEEYIELFRPLKLVKQKTHYCVGDTFTMMLFEA